MIKLDQKIIIATHELVYGVPQALKDYLLKRKADHLLFIVLPFIVAKKASYILYQKGEKIKEEKSNRTKELGVLDFFIDFFNVVRWVNSSGNVYDVFIGVNNLNSLAGLLLKKMGRVKKVIFYTMDFVPIRFENKILNWIYHKIEAICVEKCDEVWNVSPRMAAGREKFLGISAKKYPQKVVPVGTWIDKIKKRSLDEIKSKQILFIGHLSGEKQGLEEVFESLPLVKKKTGDVKLLIIGGGDYEVVLREKVKELGLNNDVIFKGWVLERDKIDELLSESAVAVATYKPEKGWLHNFSYFADPYKIKDYLGAGVPIIMTDVSYNVKDVAKNKCGIIVKYDKHEIAKALTTLLSDEKKLKEYRRNALQYVRNFDWAVIYDKIFER